MIIVIVCVILFFLLLSIKEKFFHNFDYCDCGILSAKECGHCQNCVWCVGYDGFGTCVKGDKNGPKNKIGCVKWYRNYAAKCLGRGFDYWRGHQKGGSKTTYNEIYAKNAKMKKSHQFATQNYFINP
jgi:hypothetical protein